MDMELQKAMQVSQTFGALDGYLLIILGILVVAGILGGVANYFLRDRLLEPEARDWLRYPVLGVVAALTVPLFLNMISSNLLEGARTRPVDFFVLAGFCLIYVVASRRLFENMANKLLSQLDLVKGDVRQLQERKPEVVVQEAQEAVVKELPKEALSYNDVELLRAIAEENYVYGNLAGLADKTGLGRELISQRRTVLKGLGIIETRINEKNVLHWFVSTKGKQLLGDILSGQEEKKSA
ncbi:MAG TPA: YEATS-associated helix-containing protein [Azospira sp.]|nr:YEATS-associated helix-containing protein [Azospira sp.]